MIDYRAPRTFLERCEFLKEISRRFHRHYLIGFADRSVTLLKMTLPLWSHEVQLEE